MSDHDAGRGSGSGVSLMLALPTPCALVDRAGRVEFANAAWASGLSALQVPAGRSFVDALAGMGGGGAAAAEGVRELLAERRSEFMCDLCVDEASAAWVRVFAARDGGGGGGAGKSALVMVVHIADHPAARAGLESEQRLKRIVESAMDGIITIDEQGRIVMFNEAAEKMFWVSAADAMGSRLERFMPMSARDSHARHVRHFGETGVSSRGMGNLGTVHGLRSDGTEFPIEASISQAQVGSRKFYSAILRDITERKRLEAQLLQSQKMEGIGRLAGGIAHDFNNLIMAIFNYLALASRRLGPEHPVTASLAQANQAAQRAADLTRQLLTFARKQTAEPKILAPKDVVTGLTPMLGRLIGEDVTLRTVLAPETGNVRADPAQLEQVIVNLAVNARDAMPAGGTLTIETGNEVLDAAYCRGRIDATPGEHVVLSVTDTGVGMTPQVMARIFEPFFTTKPAGKGTGLGLATCHGIVKSSGGHIGVYSEVGRGTSVRVYLPRAMSDATKVRESAAPKPVPTGTETVLLAEDSAMVRELLSEELRGAGYTVLAAESGPEALRLADEHMAKGGRLDLLLTDVVMPEMSGVQLAERLKESTKTQGGVNLCVIYMSGYTEETIAHHGVDPTTSAFIAKPCMADTLLRLVHRVLRDGKK